MATYLILSSPLNLTLVAGTGFILTVSSPAFAFSIMAGQLTATGSLLAAKSIYNLFFHPLASYPGPWLSRASRLHYVYHQLNGTLPYKTLDWHDKYGEVVRVAPDELSYNSARAYHEIHCLFRTLFFSKLSELLIISSVA